MVEKKLVVKEKPTYVVSFVSYTGKSLSELTKEEKTMAKAKRYANMVMDVRNDVQLYGIDVKYF